MEITKTQLKKIAKTYASEMQLKESNLMGSENACIRLYGMDMVIKEFSKEIKTLFYKLVEQYRTK
jgi:hypothetical protein